MKLVDYLKDEVAFYKVGSELFFKAHLKVIDELKSRGKKIFLDLKLNDIPRTISETVTVLAETQVEYISLFTSEAGIKAARERLNQEFISSTQAAPKIFNVTVLTSDENSNMTDKVLQRSQMSYRAGSDGIICSGLETKKIKNELPSSFKVINPGIRINKDYKNDQKRVVSPTEAYSAGADHIVMGRPIYSSKDPRGVIRNIFENLERY